MVPGLPLLMVAKTVEAQTMTEEVIKEEGLFKADAVNEEDPERDRATQVRRRRMRKVYSKLTQ